MSVAAAPGAWERQRRRATLVLLAAPLLAVLVLFVAPMLQLAWLSLGGPDGPTLAHYAELGRPLYARLTLFTFELALGITVLSLLLGYPLAVLIASIGGATARWITAILLASLWLSLLARTYGWVVLLQRNGVVNDLLTGAGLVATPLELVYNRLGVAIGMTHLLLPFMVVSLVPALRAIDPRLVRAAASLGARPARVFLKVYLPLSMPGVAAGSVIVFIMALGYFVTPAILGGGRATTISIAIRNQVQMLVDLPLAAATSMALLAISIAALVVYERLAGVDRIFAGARR